MTDGKGEKTGRLLVANRGEIAIRICRTAAALGLPSVAVHPVDDAVGLHVRMADTAVQLPGRGVAAYLDIAAVIDAARAARATMIHPGYGFLAENADFARACAGAGLAFVGPSPEALALFGDKHAARRLAEAEGVPVLPGTAAPTDLATARAFLAELGPGGAVMVKAVAGGGGRGMRPVTDPAALEEAFSRCRSEAESAFGDGTLYVERLLTAARHVEVQVLGDGVAAAHLWERDCSLQRRRQKIVELAPVPGLDPALRDRLLQAAVRLTAAAGYRGLGTVEFLVDPAEGSFFFIEANPRLQVEHTVTEAVTGMDLVELQLRLAAGADLAALGLDGPPPAPRGMAMQLRINTETMTADGEARPGGGTLSVYEPPSGPGIRVDGCGYAGLATSPAYDSLLAKLIVHAPSGRPEDLAARAYRALCEFRIAGVPTNIPFLQALLRHEAVRAGAVDTGFVAAHAGALVAAADHPQLHAPAPAPAVAGAGRAARAGAQVDHGDPLAVLAYGQSSGRGEAAGAAAERAVPDGMQAVRTPLQGTIVSLAVAEGDRVAAGTQLAVMEAMKMEHVIAAEASGIVRALHAGPGDTLWEDELLLVLEPAEGGGPTAATVEAEDPDHIRPDLAEVLARRAMTADAGRPAAVARRRKTGQRTVRENVADLVDPDSFVEYGPLVVAAQRRRRDMADLLERSPADGLVTGVGRVNGDLFDDPQARAAVLAYDYTVFAGTQGVHNHWKTDRLLEVAERGRMPLVLFAEGGGGRPGDGDYGGFVGQNTFHHFARLSGLVPMVGIVSGRCFAGNAALLGCCDVVIAAADANIGMGGPAMIEGGGLGIFTPEEIGPVSEQAANGVIDCVTADEAEAVSVARRYLSYFQGRLRDWTAPDQRRMRSLVPENRLRVYQVRRVIETLADEGSMLELRGGFGRTMVTALARVEGRPVGIVANDPAHLGGAIDSEGSDKAARFMQLCDAFDIPLLFLCDTPGIMVGPEAERTALVRHAARLFVVGANLSVPYFTVVLRKAYGLGAIGMAGGNFRAPNFAVSWPTGEFGSMGLEGQVKLGYRAELAAIEDPAARRQAYDEMVAAAYEEGKALARSTSFAIDDTIDPAETRHWLASLLAAQRPVPPREGKKRPMIDAW
ncbi:carboxyl transferase domain-containing protein [Marinibaculum pumilum]|uniref:Carboxyl transferase domain-containing protein n=1 Tax=Marinibaculum pumilum TaxID=1766165 RepID=A0ABV7L8H0_9PROT